MLVAGSSQSEGLECQSGVLRLRRSFCQRFQFGKSAYGYFYYLTSETQEYPELRSRRLPDFWEYCRYTAVGSRVLSALYSMMMFRQ